MMTNDISWYFYFLKGTSKAMAEMQVFSAQLRHKHKTLEHNFVFQEKVLRHLEVNMQQASTDFDRESFYAHLNARLDNIKVNTMVSLHYRFIGFIFPQFHSMKVVCHEKALLLGCLFFYCFLPSILQQLFQSKAYLIFKEIDKPSHSC